MKTPIHTNQSLGVIGSSLEHLVLEQLFATNGEQGFSAVKAIQVANQEGQKIFTITKDNYQEIIPQLNLASSAIADIESAAKAGYTVTTHQNRISLNSYTGEGYIILDSSGNGAWMINGGMYGGGLALAKSSSDSGYFSPQVSMWIATQLFVLDKTFEVFHGSLPPVQQLFGSIIAGLGIGSNILDFMKMYDGTADCFNFIVAAITVEIMLALLSIIFRPWVGFVISYASVGFHYLAGRAGENYHCNN